MFKNLSPFALGITGHQSEIIELALTYGFEGIDLDVADFANRAKLRGMDYARRLIDSARIRIGTFRLPTDWEAEEEAFKKSLTKLADYAKAARDIGCTRCVASVAPASETRPYHENFEFHRERFQRVCESLAQGDIRLGLGFQAAAYLRKDKPLQFIHDLEGLSQLVGMIGAPNVGLWIDLWDLIVSGGSGETLESLAADKVVAVQIAQVPADVPAEELGPDSRLLPNDENGRIDVPAVLHVLKRKGYEGPVSVKPSRAAFESRKRDVIVRRTGESLDAIWQAIGFPPRGKFAQPEPTAATAKEEA